MSRNKKSTAALLACLGLTAWLATSPAVGASCPAGPEQAPNSTVMVHASSWSQEQCLWTRLDSPGLLAVELMPVAEGSSTSRLDLFDAGCQAAGVEYLDLGPGRVLARVASAGDYFYCVAADGAGAQLAGFRLAQAFLPAEESLTSAQSWRFSGSDDRDEDEPDPNPFSSDGRGSSESREPDDRDEDEPDPNPISSDDGRSSQSRGPDDRDEDEPDPNPLSDGPGADSLASRPTLRDLDALCERSVSDDHGDLSWCATTLQAGDVIGASLSGESDVDVFTFAVEAVSRVTLFTRGDVEASLVDRNGVQLGSNTVRHPITRTLAPGRYYVRVFSPVPTEYSLALVH